MSADNPNEEKLNSIRKHLAKKAEWLSQALGSLVKPGQSFEEAMKELQEDINRIAEEDEQNNQTK